MRLFGCLYLIIVQTREAAPAAPAETAATAPLGEGARGEEEVNEASEASPGSSYRGGGNAALPASNLVYKAKDYWDERFQVEQDYDVRPLLYPPSRRARRLLDHF